MLGRSLLTDTEDADIHILWVTKTH
jgi:hypothetical protein